MINSNDVKFKIVKEMIISKYYCELAGCFLYAVYTKEEWSMGRGCRYPEFEDCNLDEAIDQAKNY